MSERLARCCARSRRRWRRPLAAAARDARAVHAASNGALLTWGMAAEGGDPAAAVGDRVGRVLS